MFGWVDGADAGLTPKPMSFFVFLGLRADVGLYPIGQLTDEYGDSGTKAFGPMCDGR
jgi:hypothetical protein